MGIHGNDIMDEKQIAGASANDMDKKIWRTPLVEKLDVKVHTHYEFTSGSDAGALGS